MLKAGGVNCWHQSVGGLDHMAGVLTFLDQHPDKIVQAGTVREIRQLREQGKIAHLSGWQMADPLIEDANGAGPVQNLRAYRQLGLRIASIAYNNSNIFGGGCLDPDLLLTRLGKKYVEVVHKLRKAGFTGRLRSWRLRTTDRRSKTPVAAGKTHANRGTGMAVELHRRCAWFEARPLLAWSLTMKAGARPSTSP